MFVSTSGDMYDGVPHSVYVRHSLRSVRLAIGARVLYAAPSSRKPFRAATPGVPGDCNGEAPFEPRCICFARPKSAIRA